VASGALVIHLVENRALVRGTLDGPDETIDWYRIEGSSRPAQTLATGTFHVSATTTGDVRSLEVDFFRGSVELGAHHEYIAHGYRFRVHTIGTPMTVRFAQGGDAGSYELAIAYVPDPDWLQLDVPPPPDLPAVPPPEKPFCKPGEGGTHCRVEPCDWRNVDAKNPRCAPGMP
jgi:hypothetical protein